MVISIIRLFDVTIPFKYRIFAIPHKVFPKTVVWLAFSYIFLPFVPQIKFPENIDQSVSTK